MRHFALSFGDRTGCARIAAMVNVAIGVLCLMGWTADLKSLTGLAPGSVDMKVNTALCIIACGGALLISCFDTSRALRRVARLLILAVILVTLVTLAEYCFGWQSSLDEFLFKDRTGAYNVFRGRMSPYTAAALAAIAGAMLARPHPRIFLYARWGAVLGLAVGLVSLLGYLWDASEIVTDQVLPPVAVNTGFCLALLGGGVLLMRGPVKGERDDSAQEFAAVELKIILGFIGFISLLLLGGGYTYRSDARFADSLQRIAETQEIRASLASLYGSLAGAEVAMRDYLLTADNQHHAEYQRLIDAVLIQEAALRRLTVNNPVQQKNLNALIPVVDSRLSDMRSEIGAFTDFGLPAARALIALNRNTGSTRVVRGMTERMAALEEHELLLEQHAVAGERKITLLSVLATLGVAVIFFALLLRGIHREMLARRGAENALRSSEEYNRSIVDSSPDCLTLLALDGRMKQMTPQGCRLMEVDDFSSIADTDWLSTWADEDRPVARAAFHAACGGKDGRFQAYCSTRKGTPKWWDVIVMPVIGTSGRPERVLAVARDITEVKQGEKELLEANRFLDSLIENLPVMVVVKDAAELRFIRVNRSFEHLLGYSRAELLGKDAYQLFTAEEAERVIETDREALDQGCLIDIPEQQLHTERLGFRIYHTMKLPLNDAAGKPQYLLSISVDITERRLAEQAIHALNAALEAKAEQLTASNRELESFSYSVSHDLRAPLRAIDGFAQMIEEDYAEKLDEEGRRFLAVIRDSSKRMGKLIDDLLAFSRLGRLPVVSHEINVESLVHEVVAEALHTHDRVAPCIKIGSLPPSYGDPSLLRQVWANLISNAIKYSSKVPDPVIEVTGRRSGPENLYSIRDNGVGFDMEYADKLFGVFQRLHRAEEFGGTGVGLAIVHRVVTRHGGRVWAEGRVNEGAEFSFSLPEQAVDG